MAWTPPGKFTVFLTFLLMAFAVFIVLDQSVAFWPGTYLPTFFLTGYSSFQSWMIIAAVVIFFSWFLFFLGVKLKGM
jgi:hypothetical protein